MKKTLLSSIAALFLATGTAHADAATDKWFENMWNRVIAANQSQVYNFSCVSIGQDRSRLALSIDPKKRTVTENGRERSFVPVTSTETVVVFTNGSFSYYPNDYGPYEYEAAGKVYGWKSVP